MREIKIPEKGIRAAVGQYGVAGQYISVPVAVDWPELQLTEEQIIANGLARAAGQPAIYPNNAVFAVMLPYVVTEDE